MPRQRNKTGKLADVMCVRAHACVILPCCGSRFCMAAGDKREARDDDIQQASDFLESDGGTHSQREVRSRCDHPFPTRQQGSRMLICFWGCSDGLDNLRASNSCVTVEKNLRGRKQNQLLPHDGLYNTSRIWNPVKGTCAIAAATAVKHLGVHGFNITASEKVTKPQG